MITRKESPMEDLFTENCMGEQASLEFDLTFGDVLLHKLVQAYEHSKSNNFFNCKNLKFGKDHCV